MDVSNPLDPNMIPAMRVAVGASIIDGSGRPSTVERSERYSPTAWIIAVRFPNGVGGTYLLDRHELVEVR